MLRENRKEIVDLLPGTGCVCKLVTGFMDQDLYETLFSEIDFYGTLRMGAPSPSLMTNQCDTSTTGLYPLYRHPLDSEPKVTDWTPTVAAIRDAIQEFTAQPSNHCLIRLYRNGLDFIREHSDKTIDILPGTCMLNYSAGASRTMYLKHKETRKSIKFVLPGDSLLIMDLRTNAEYFHSIKRHANFLEPRISLTFRSIGTFKDPETGVVTGQGAEHKDFINQQLIDIYLPTNARTQTQEKIE